MQHQSSDTAVAPSPPSQELVTPPAPSDSKPCSSSDHAVQIDPSPDSSTAAAADDVSKPAAELAEKLTNVNFSHRQIMSVYVALLFCMAISALDTTVVSVAAPSITQQFNNFSSFGWVSAAYLATRSACTPLYGRLSDIYGRRALMEVALLLFVIGSVVSATAGSMIALIIGRAIQGMGGAGLGSLVSTIVGDMVPPARRGKYQGLLSSSFGVFTVAGPVIGGGIISGLSWRWIFWINLPICFVSGVVIWWLVIIPPNAPHKRLRDADWVGSVLIMASSVSLLIALQWGGVVYSWSSFQVLVPLLLSMAGFCALVVTEHIVGDDAIIPLDMLKSRNFTVTFVSTILTGMGLFGTIGYLPNYFQLVYGDDETISGLRTAPMIGSFVIMSIVAGRSMSREKGKRVNYLYYCAAGNLVTLIGAFIQASLLDINIPYYAFAILLAVQGGGYGVTMPVIQVVTQTSVPLKRLAVASTANAFARSLGGAVGIAIVALTLNNQYQSQLVEQYSAQCLGQPPANVLSYTRQQIDTLSPEVQRIFEVAYTAGMSQVFYVLGGIATATMCVSLGLRPETLRG